MPHSSFSPLPIQLRGRLNGAQRMRLQTLLDMQYTTTELAAHVGFTRRQIYRVYEKLGCPHTRDFQGHLWINGAEFRRWYHRTYPPIKLGENEAFCATCRRAMPIIEPQHIEKKGLVYLRSTCPVCERILIRFVENQKTIRQKDKK